MKETGDNPEDTRDILEPSGRMIAYFPSMAKMTGSIKATILLQQIKYHTSRWANDDPWICMSVNDWREETGLTEREFREAYALLLKDNFIDRRYDRINHQLYLRLNVSQYNNAIREMTHPIENTPNDKTSFRNSPNDKTSFRERQNVISGNDKTSVRIKVVKKLGSTEVKTEKTKTVRARKKSETTSHDHDDAPPTPAQQDEAIASVKPLLDKMLGRSMPPAEEEVAAVQARKAEQLARAKAAGVLG